MRLSPPSLGSSVKIEEGTLAFGNDKNLWLRKKRNDKNTYWSSFAELNLELGIPTNQESNYYYLQIQWEIPDFGIFYLTYINSGRITFQSFANNSEELLFLNVPLIRASSNRRRIEAFKDIIFDFIDDLRLRPDMDLQLITTMSQELNKLFNVLLNGFYDISENYLDKNDYDFQASIDFPLKRTFRPNSDDLFVLDITNAEQEPTPTPQPETPEAEKGLPSIDPQTWNGEFKIGDKVKVRWDFSNDLGLEKTKGFSKVDYFSSENNYSVVNVITSSDSMRPENITGKLYELNTGQFWEGKDLELITEQEQPTPTPQPDEFKPIWRFKTEQEFIDEFGDDWRRSLNWLRGSDNMDYLFGKPVTNPNFDGENLPPTRFDTAEELGIDSGGDNTWYLNSNMFTKIDYDQPEPIDIDDLEDGKLFFKSKDNVNTYLKTNSETTELLMYTNGWQFIQPTYWSNESFIFRATQKLLDLNIDIIIDLIYETGINIYYSNIETREVINVKNITNPTDFKSLIDEIREKVGIDNELSQELGYLEKVYSRDIWKTKKIKCAFVEQESSPMIGKLFLKQNYDTYLEISENEDRLVLNSDEFQYIKPFRYDSSVFTFNSTYNAKTFGIALRINLDYEKGISISYKNEKTNYEFFKENITSESVFYTAIGDVRRFFVNPQFEKELDAIASLLINGIWRERSIVCDFMSSIPYPKFAVGDKVRRKDFEKQIFTITSITTFDDKQQQWDYDVVEDISGGQSSFWENELELVSTEIPTTSECDVDVSLIDSQYVGQFYQQNKNRIEALNPNISCLFLEALLSLSNYEKCGDGVEIPMPQPKKEEKEDLLSQIRNL